MGQRKRTPRKPDKRGRIPAVVGWKQNDKGKWVQHTFYLGADENEANRRRMRLDELWDRIEYESVAARQRSPQHRHAAFHEVVGDGEERQGKGF